MPSLLRSPTAPIEARSEVAAPRVLARPHRPSTPSLYAVTAVVTAAWLLGLAAVAGYVADQHRRAADSIASDSSRLVVEAEELYVSLAAADAAATTAFLQGGLERQELRTRYTDSIDSAASGVAKIAGERELPAPLLDAVTAVSAQLPRYTALIEAARTDNRLQFPVGAAYLRDASDLMRDTILPAATLLYDGAAHELDGDYRTGTEPHGLTVVQAMVVGALVLLIGAQIVVARRSRRVFNVGLLLATVLVLALGGLATAVLRAQQHALERSERDGAEPLLVESTARILVLRSLSDENLDLVERGTDRIHMDDFATVTDALGDAERGIIGELARQVSDRSRATPGVVVRYGAYLDAHDDVRALAASNQYADAIEVAATELAPAAASFDRSLNVEIRESVDLLEQGADDAVGRVRGLTLWLVLLPGCAAALAVTGLQRRIKEYR